MPSALLAQPAWPWRTAATDLPAPLNATARKVAAGAAETTPVATVTNLARTLKLLKDAGLWIVGADASALYARNVLNFLALSLNLKTGEWKIARDDEIVQATLVCDAGQATAKK